MENNKDLYGFLHPELIGEKEIVVSSRFKDKDGKVIPFTIRPLSQDVCDEIQKQCIRTDKKGNSVFDRVKYVSETTAASVVFPDLQNADLQKAYGVLGSVQLLSKMLYSNEYNDLVEAVQELSGLNESFQEVKDEAKNV